jgi:endo-1,4-beta-xylanase
MSKSLSTSLYKNFNFPVGASIKLDQLITNPSYKALALSQFNSYTTETAFKGSTVHPELNTYNWEEAETLIHFADQHKKRMHGHTLVWQEDLPLWMKNFQGEQNAWTDMLRSHVETIVSHFRGRVKSWDVLNEAFNANGTLSENLWKEHLGETYIAQVFHFAQRADPDARLFYNDFDLEVNPVKRKAVLDHLLQMRSDGCRVDGVGLQLHLDIGFSTFTELETALLEIAAAEFAIHLSEIDVSVNPVAGEMVTEPFFDRQAEVIAQVVEIYNRLPKKNQYGITFWGIGDADSWMRYAPGAEKNYPLLFDDHYRPKKAYEALLRRSQG